MLQHTATHSATHYAELEMEEDILEVTHTFSYLSDVFPPALHTLNNRENDILRLVYENVCMTFENVFSCLGTTLSPALFFLFLSLSSISSSAYSQQQAKSHRMPYLYRSFSAKEPYN